MSKREQTESSHPPSHIERRGSEDAILGQLVREARVSLQPPAVDWSHVEARLFERVAAVRASEEATARFAGRRTVWGTMAGAVAMAAAATLILGGGHEHREVQSAAFTTGNGNGAGVLVAKRGAGEALGVVASGSDLASNPGTSNQGTKSALSSGARVAMGSTLETHGAEALFEVRGHASWLLEDDSRTTVKADAPLVLGLERGAIEAEVVPVSAGEAFAIDIADVRIAVHGTHLRVARHDDLVTIDLSEGVVSIGQPPRVGSTYGALVVAPAHVEFSLGGALRITHDPSALRASVDLASFSTVAEAKPSASRRSSELASDVPPSPGRSPLSSGSPAVPHAQAGSRPAAPASVDPHPEETLAAAVRACAADRPHSTDVTVTVSSTLDVTVGDDGFVRAARFDPPLAPEIQTCASTAIYRTRFGQSGARRVSILLER